MTQSLFLVAGLGKTGLSIARYLRRKNKKFIVYDTRTKVPNFAAFQEQFPEVAFYLGEIPDQIIAKVSDVITSPGIPLETACIAKAKQAGAAVYGDIECLAREITAPVVAITGTNGKSSVTTLVGEMAQHAGLKVAVAGNIGTPVLDMLQDKQQFDLWVLELSSFQLDLIYSLKPKIATILNISEDHLDRHHTLSAYIASKQRIYRHAQAALFNRDDAHTVPSAEYKHNGACVSFGQDIPADENWGLIKQSDTIYLAKGKECYISADSLQIKGMHNWLNALAAMALAEAVAIPIDSILAVLKTFAGLRHRCQWVRTLDEVHWINDSKGTNIGATLSAINGIGGAMQGKIVLIAGGQGKGADFTQLKQAMVNFVRSIVLIGEDADKIEKALEDSVPVSRADSLDKAVDLAKSKAKPGDVVLLSPACASLDMFRDFNHRGEVFTNLVHGI